MENVRRKATATMRGEEARSSGTRRSVRVRLERNRKGTQETSTWNKADSFPNSLMLTSPSHPSELELDMGSIVSFRWVTWEGTCRYQVETNSNWLEEKSWGKIFKIITSVRECPAFLS